MNDYLEIVEDGSQLGGLFFCVFLACCAATLLILRRSGWPHFARTRKWASRAVLFVLLSIIGISLSLTPRWISTLMPVQLSSESPHLTSTAIKLGIYGVYIDHELSARLSPDKRNLTKCITALSHVDIQNQQAACGDTPACYKTIPTLTREDIIAKIRDVQKEKTSFAFSSCKDVDVTKL